MCSTTTGARLPPVSLAARPSTSSNRSIWRRKDSSENTPSTTPSDEAGCICPAEPVSVSPSSESSARLGHAARGREIHVRSTGGRHKKARELSGAAAAVAAVVAAPTTRDGCRSPASFVSIPTALVLRPDEVQQEPDESDEFDEFDESDEPDEPDESESALPPILAPLEPLHLPPVRRATPPGLPSYENTRRSQPRLCGGGGSNSNSGAGGGSSSGPHGFSLSSSMARWRRSWQLHGDGHRGSHGHRTSGGPVWRPPTSQHSIANHPFLRDMPPVDCSMQAASRGVPRNNHTPDVAPDTSAVAMAETEARAGRVARPVTLDDYRFLRSLNGSEPAAATRTGPDEHRAAANNGGTTVPSAVLCLKWCVPPCLCPFMFRPDLSVT